MQTKHVVANGSLFMEVWSNLKTFSKWTRGFCCFVVSTHQNKHARSWCSTPRWLNINIWVVNLGYRNNRMVKTKHGLESVVPQVFNFDPYPWKTTKQGVPKGLPHRHFSGPTCCHHWQTPWTVMRRKSTQQAPFFAQTCWAHIWMTSNTCVYYKWYL